MMINQHFVFGKLEIIESSLMMLSNGKFQLTRALIEKDPKKSHCLSIFTSYSTDHMHIACD